MTQTRTTLTEHSGFCVGQRVYLREATMGGVIIELPDDEEREDEIVYPIGTPALIERIERFAGPQGIAFTLSIGEISNTFDQGDGPIGDFISAEPVYRRDVEMPNMLVLSTSHIEFRTSLRFDGKRSGAAPFHYPKGEHGWFIPLVPWEQIPETQRTTWTPDLMKVREFALARGCLWICLDQAGEVVEDLPTYDW